MTFAALLSHFDAANLRLRVLSSLMLAPLALLAVWLGGFTYDALLTAVTALGLFEWLRLTTHMARPRLVAAACLMLVVAMGMGIAVSPAFGLVVVAGLSIALYAVARRGHVESAAWVALGLPYMGASGLALLLLRHVPGRGEGLVFFLFATVWATDIGAFAAGRLIGGPKLAPAISPSKTWAGLIGGMVSALVLGYFAAALFGGLNPVAALVLAPLLAVVAQAGDLFESFVKRRGGAKDSGDLIPGHGGVLDRIDGLVFAAILLALIEAGGW